MIGESINQKNFLDFVFDFHQSMEKNKVLLVYEGEITHQITKAFTSLTETNMQKEQEAQSTQKKVFHAMVECLQNISKHSECMYCKESQEKRKGVFLLTQRQKEYHITTGNMVKVGNIDKIKSILDKINNLDREGLKALYKHQIKEGRLSNKGGAGLGFIDIAKKTGNQLLFSFAPINEDYSFFILSCKVARQN